MSIAHPPSSVPYAQFVAIEHERDQWRSRYEQEHQAHTHTKQERDQWHNRYAQEHQRQQQRRKLLKTPFKSTEKLVIEEMQRQVESPHAQHDEQGYTRFCYATAGINIGTDDKTAKRSINAILEQCPNFPIQTKEVKEPRPNGQRGTIKRLYIKPTTQQNLIAAAASITELQHKREQGGNQYQCQKCLSHHVMIKRRLCCLDCGHETDLEPTFPNGKLKGAETAKSTKTNLSTVPFEAPAADRADTIQTKAAEPTKTNLSTTSTDTPPTQNFLSQDGQLVDVVIKPVTPPNADKLSTAQAENNQTESEPEHDEIAEAAALLLEIAGPHEAHIVMPRQREEKYLEVKRPLQLEDLISHLRRGEARGARCSYPNGETRALCKDADDIDLWNVLEEAARRLAQAGYMPILEESPAPGRGGHFWILFDGLVDTAVAWRQVYQIAPELESIAESWPSPGKNRVRLPGGFYKHGEVKAWCLLTNIATGETSRDGAGAASLLLASLTPAQIVTQDDQAEACTLCTDQDEQPAVPIIHDQAEQDTQVLASAAGGAAPLTNMDQAEQGSRLPEVDARWIERNGPVETTTLYFAIIARYAARWFNEHNSLEEIHPRERNGLALSPNGNERTASTSYRETWEGERYTDHSHHGRRADGTRDTGDALELAAKVQGVSKGQLISQTTKEITAQACAELESAARAGQAIPAWIEEIITPAGRRQYVKWLNGQGNEDEARRQTTAPAKQPEQKPAAQIGPEVPEIHTQDDQLELAPEIQDQGQQPEQKAQETPAAPAMRKIGTCLTVSYRTGKPCGSIHWYPSPDEEYICVKCLSPIAWTRRIEAERRK